MAVLADSFGFLHQNIGKQLRPSHITLLVLSSSTGLTLQFYDQYYTLNSSFRRGDIYTLTNATVENFHISNPCKYISSSKIKIISHIPYVVLSPPSNQPNQVIQPVSIHPFHHTVSTFYLCCFPPKDRL